MPAKIVAIDFNENNLCGRIDGARRSENARTRSGSIGAGFPKLNRRRAAAAGFSVLFGTEIVFVHGRNEQKGNFYGGDVAFKWISHIDFG